MAVPLAAVTLVPTHNAITTAAPMQPVERPAVVSTAEHGPPAAALAGATLPQARTPEAALVSAPAAAAVPHGDQSDQAHLPSISTDYRSAMAEAGFPGLSTDDLNDARAAGVSPEYARAMRATGMRLGIEDVIDARATNLSPAYISGLRRLEFDGAGGSRVFDARTAQRPEIDEDGPRECGTGRRHGHALFGLRIGVRTDPRIAW